MDKFVKSIQHFIQKSNLKSEHKTRIQIHVTWRGHKKRAIFFITYPSIQFICISAARQFKVRHIMKNDNKKSWKQHSTEKLPVV